MDESDGDACDGFELMAAYRLHGRTPMDCSKPSRREFCAQAVSFVAIGSLLESCGGGSPTAPSNVPALPTVSGTVSGNTITLAVDSGPLASVGSAALLQSSAGNFLIARTGQDTFNAMTAICTHQQCVVSGFDAGVFICPCHGSRYNTSGGVVQGPAPTALRRFNTSVANNVLTVSLT